MFLEILLIKIINKNKNLVQLFPLIIYYFINHHQRRTENIFKKKNLLKYIKRKIYLSDLIFIGKVDLVEKKEAMKQICAKIKAKKKN